MFSQKGFTVTAPPDAEMVFANTDCELGELNNDSGDRDRILPEYDPVSFHLSDIIKGNKIPDAIDISRYILAYIKTHICI